MKQIQIYLLALVLLILWQPMVYAQDTPPDPVEGHHGAAYVSYGHTDGASASVDHLQFDVDVSIPGTVFSVTGHFTPSGVHAGPKGSYPVGPIAVFGHHLFLASGDDAAATAIGQKTGTGVEIPLPRGAILRIGINGHSGQDGSVNELVIGFGARF